MQKTYFNDGGITITGTMFVTPRGEQYPIRNISALRVGVNNRWKIFAIILVVFCLGVAFENMQLIGLSGVAAILWFFSRTFSLFISTAGVEKPAISYSIFQREKKSFLTRVLASVSDAINAIQN